MVTPRNRRRDVKKRNRVIEAMVSVYTNYCNLKYVKSLAFDPEQLPVVSVAILFAELILNVVVVQRVNYTEIDWKAYMQECEGFLNGTTNYSLLRGTLVDQMIHITSTFTSIEDFVFSLSFIRR